MNPTASHATPSNPPPMNGAGRQPTANGNATFDWEALVPLVTHPIKVAVIEAMTYVGRPLSASMLREIFKWEWTLSRVSYHVTTLAKFGVLTKVGERPVRGAMERFYFFTSQD